MNNRYFGPVIAMAAIVAVVALTPLPAAGQDVPWYKMVHSSCPGEPGKFHPCALKKAKTFNPPRTPDGKPDMQGYWLDGPGSSQDIEEHPESYGIPGNPTLIVEPVDGKIPYQPWAAAERQKNFKQYQDPQGQCSPSGVPRVMYVPFGSQILQIPGYVVILFEQNQASRSIPTDGRPHVGQNIRLWGMDSRGRWEGDTLVVDLTNSNGRPWLDAQGNFYSAALHVVERLTMVDADTIHYDATIEDPNVYTRPWKIAFPIRRNKEPGHQQMEYACHEGERDAQHATSLGYKTYPGVVPPK